LLQFHAEQRWICPQHLPILIHQPDKLAPFLPGIGSWEAPDHDHG
jgi:hypothetical protein